MTSITETAALAVPDGVPPLADMTETELLDLARACVAEQRRREAATDTVRKIDALLVASRTADDDAAEGDGPHPWVQPTGAQDAYPKGWKVTHDGHVWVSLTPGSVHEPGVSGWRIEAPEGEVAPYTPVSGAHDAYHQGDTVTHDGKTWTCTNDVCAHAPGVQDSGWEEVTEPEPDEPVDPTDPEEPEPEPEPEEPTEPEPAPWAEGEVYGVDDLVTWEGDTYRCLQAHTAIAGWTPTAVPALWEVAA